MGRKRGQFPIHKLRENQWIQSKFAQHAVFCFRVSFPKWAHLSVHCWLANSDSAIRCSQPGFHSLLPWSILTTSEMKSSHWIVNAVANNSTRRSGAATPLHTVVGCAGLLEQRCSERHLSVPALQTSFSCLPVPGHCLNPPPDVLDMGSNSHCRIRSQVWLDSASGAVTLQQTSTDTKASNQVINLFTFCPCVLSDRRRSLSLWTTPGHSHMEPEFWQESLIRKNPSPVLRWLSTVATFHSWGPPLCKCCTIECKILWMYFLRKTVVKVFLLGENIYLILNFDLLCGTTEYTNLGNLYFHICIFFKIILLQCSIYYVLLIFFVKENLKISSKLEIYFERIKLCINVVNRIIVELCLILITE